MRAHVKNLFNLNELRKSDKMQGLLSILPLFRNESNKFNNTGARMLDYIYHMTLNIFCRYILGCESQNFTNTSIISKCYQNL